jgi:tetratricopeptide (TPR) repeat protein
MFESGMVQAQTVEDRKTQADRLLEEGIDRFNEANYKEALDKFEAALFIYREIGDRQSEAEALGRLGDNYRIEGLFEQAIEFYQQFLAIRQELGDSEKEAWALARLGNTYLEAGQYKQGIESFQAALTLQTERGDRLGQAEVLGFLGWAYLPQEQTEQSVEFLQQSLDIYQELVAQETDREQLRMLADSLDLIWDDVFVFIPQAEIKSEFYAITLVYRQAVSIYRELGDRDKERLTLQAIGDTYLAMGQSESALEFHQQYLALIQTADDRVQEIVTLNELGANYQEQQQYDRALEFYQQALSLSYDLQQQPDFAAFDLVGTTLGKLGSLFAVQKRSELAIVFYKSAINAYEKIRGEYSGSELVSESEFASVFLSKHEAEYRALADLLLQQNRVLEAQRVLDLLKVEELDNYFHDVRGNSATASGIPNLPAEQQIEGGYQAILDRAVAMV